jgi:L-aspartate oxidase
MSPVPLTAPDRLAAQPPGWEIETDTVVVGSGIAGLVTALEAQRAGRVLLVTKALLDEGSTRWAQGGIAAALDPADSPEDHLRDTLEAGVGLCDERAVRALVTDGPEAVRRLIGIGAAFDREADGSLSLTREGGHHRRRIAHAGGDATGAEVSRALLAALKQAEDVEIIENAHVLDLLKGGDGRVVGLTLHVMGEGQADGVGAVRARAVVLATGGLGQLFSATTNPEVSTGDGVALALRAGAAVTDLEFVQFHPTVMWLGPEARGRQPLITEAVRGEGAYLIDSGGQRFMIGRHEMAELAPRDVVAKGIMARMLETGEPCMFLDGRHLGERVWSERFPNILENCRSHGVDPVTQPIPVLPAAHYASGGIRTDLSGRTSVPGLYACGEVACTGVHGANRLASNSLLEGLVFAERIAADLRVAWSADHEEVAEAVAWRGNLDPSVRNEVQEIMSEYVGVLRSAEGLAAAELRLAELSGRTATEPGLAAWEATNLHLVATALVAAARRREETRGSHWREDFPDRDDDRWLGHLVTRLQDGRIVTAYEPKRRRASGGPVVSDRAAGSTAR